MTHADFNRLINGSIQYEFNGTVLTITGYRDGRQVSIDLGQMTDEMFEELVVDDDEDAKREYIYSIVADMEKSIWGNVDEMAEEIADRIIEDNGFNLDEDEVREIATEFFEELE